MLDCEKSNLSHVWPLLYSDLFYISYNFAKAAIMSTIKIQGRSEVFALQIIEKLQLYSLFYFSANEK